MINFLRNLNISSSSYWLGVLTGVLLAWILSRLIIYIPRGIKSIRLKIVNARESFSVSGEVRLRNDIYRFAQTQHIASPLFSLDEIVIVPKVLTPLNQISISAEQAPTDCVSLTVPYLPDWPELASIYHASTMRLDEAIQGGANIILTGHPGSGKTVALAWLASLISRNDPDLGMLEGSLPLYVQATDIIHQINKLSHSRSESITDQDDSHKLQPDKSQIKDYLSNDLIEILVKSISTYASPLTITRLPALVRIIIDKQRAILLLDRLDELPPNQVSYITEFLQSLLEKFPKLRVIAAASYENLAGLPSLGFSLLAMAAWGDDERAEFLQQWSQHWDKWILPFEKDRTGKILPHYLNSWLSINNTMLKPLEYTLKVWAAYSGDILGSDGSSAIEAYILRMTRNMADRRSGLEQFALQLLKDMRISSDPNDFTRSTSNISDSNIPNSDDQAGTDTIKPSQIKSITGIDTLINNGLFRSYPDLYYGFSHPILNAFLASNRLTELEILKQIQSQPAWVGKTLALYYFARNGDVAPLINDFIQEDDLIHTNHLQVARWLQIAPNNRQWRTSILRTLASILQKEKDTISLTAKIISALAFSGDAGVSLYFRQLLKSDDPTLKHMAALGCGILKDKKAIEDLNIILQDQSPSSIRAASLALAAIGDKQSLEILASNLLNGTEQMRRYAAEALANDSTEGFPALKDGSTMEDLMVRRSVVFGLVRINQPWALKIVENMQLEDNEWVVRNAAIQAFDELSRKKSYAPAPPSDPTETQWLIDFASKIGTTVAPGAPADELAIKALSQGSQDEILHALDYLRSKDDSETIQHIYSTFTNNSGEIKDATYYVLWLMIISGIKLPTSIKYNIL